MIVVCVCIGTCLKVLKQYHKVPVIKYIYALQVFTFGVCILQFFVQ